MSAGGADTVGVAERLELDLGISTSAAQQLVGVTPEGDDGRQALGRGAELEQLVQQPLVAEVHAVEDADDHRRTRFDRFAVTAAKLRLMFALDSDPADLISQVVGRVRSQLFLVHLSEVAENVIVPAGQIGGPPATPGTEFSYTVRTRGRLNSAEEFGNVIVRSNPDGSQVRVKDVARVELGTQSYNAVSRLNGVAPSPSASMSTPASRAAPLQPPATERWTKPGG